jgi:hypothetical protein
MRPGSDSPNDDPWQGKPLGRYGKAAGLFTDLHRRLCCESEWGNAMGVRVMRAKLFFVMAAALLWSASVFSENFSMGSFVSGNDLFGVCSDDHHFNQAYCKGYVVGVADALMAPFAFIAFSGTS